MQENINEGDILIPSKLLIIGPRSPKSTVIKKEDDWVPKSHQEATKLGEKMYNESLDQKVQSMPTNYKGKGMSIFLASEKEMLSTKVLDLTLLDIDTLLITVPDGIQVITQEETPESEVPEDATIELYYRCPSCSRRTLAKTKTIRDEVKCNFCQKPLSLIHWNGRMGSHHNMPLVEILPEFVRKWLKTNGWIEAKIGLWVNTTKEVVNYVDFRKDNDKPNLYAYKQEGGRVDEVTPELKKVNNELIPYFDRPTAKEIAMRMSAPGRILEAQKAKDHEDKPPEERTEINPVSFNGQKCPKCGAEDMWPIVGRVLEVGHGEIHNANCYNCQHTCNLTPNAEKVDGEKEGDNDGSGNGIGPTNIDQEFF